MVIRHAEEKDVARMMEIYAYARDFMEKTGNPYQWGPTNWPPEPLIHEDIKAGKSYVCVEGERILGAFYFDHGENIEPTYEVIEDGAWIGDADCINWAYEQCGHLRIDTHTDNKVMQNLLLKLGFTQCGIIHVVEDNYPRFAYEKV